jgi:hypothetical protein
MLYAEVRIPPSSRQSVSNAYGIGSRSKMPRNGGVVHKDFGLRFKPLSRLPGTPWARKHDKNSTITTSHTLNRPPPMALKTCAVMTTTALRG